MTALTNMNFDLLSRLPVDVHKAFDLDGILQVVDEAIETYKAVPGPVGERLIRAIKYRNDLEVALRYRDFAQHAEDRERDLERRREEFSRTAIPELFEQARAEALRQKPLPSSIMSHRAMTSTEPNGTLVATLDVTLFNGKKLSFKKSL